MDKKNFNHEYEKFGIPKENIPQYENPQQFAGQYKRCEVLNYRNVSYSNSTRAQKQLKKGISFLK